MPPDMPRSVAPLTSAAGRRTVVTGLAIFWLAGCATVVHPTVSGGHRTLDAASLNFSHQEVWITCQGSSDLCQGVAHWFALLGAQIYGCEQALSGP